MFRVWAWVTIWAMSAAAPLARADGATDLQTLLHILDYVAVDYPGVIENGQIVNPAEYREQKEFASQMTVLAARLPASEEQLALQSKAATLAETIGQAARISGITPATISLLLVHLKSGVASRKGMQALSA